MNGRLDRRTTLGVGAPRLVVREDQLRELAAAIDLAFVEQLAKTVATRLPLTLQGARAMVTDTVTRAAGYGLREASAVAEFVDLVVTHGPSFDERSGVRRLLRDQGASPEARLAAVRARLTKPDPEEL
jgi:hypothetical protein